MAAWSRRQGTGTVADVVRLQEGERDYQRRLGKVIVQLRALAVDESGRQMSQAILAERVNRSEAAVSRWETGKATPSAFDLRRIAEIFELEDEHLDLLVHPPEGPVSPVAERLQAAVEAGARRGRVPDGPGGAGGPAA